MHARILLAERFPAFEFHQLLYQAAQSLRRRFRQQAGSGLEFLDIVGSGARGLQLSGGERLFSGVQQAVDLLAHCVRFLLGVLNQHEPALLDDDHCGFEALGKGRRPKLPVHGLPPRGEFSVIGGRVCSEFLCFDD